VAAAERRAARCVHRAEDRIECRTIPASPEVLDDMEGGRGWLLKEALASVGALPQ